MKTVLGFDSWAQGAHNYGRHVEALRRRGFQLKLVHLGSWGHDKGRPRQEMIGELPVYDISFYGGAGFREILQRERPEAIIFLSTETFVHRAFNRYARQLNVPTLHLYHGLVNVQATYSDRPDHYPVLSLLYLVVSRLWKLATRTWPVYMKALFNTKATSDEWLRFFGDVIAQGTGRYRKVASGDARTDYCAVYTKADVPHAVSKYQIDESNVRQVGNPDLVKFGIKRDDLVETRTTVMDTDTIVFIDHGGSAGGFAFQSEKDFVNFLKITAHALERHNLKLIVKLHPAQYLTPVPQMAADARIQLCGNAEFIHQLKHCKAVIGTSSSASLIPALLGIPMLLAQYGRFQGQLYGTVLTSYPRARYLAALEDVPRLLDEEQASFDPERLRAWREENAGPLPAEEMPDRVADIIVEMTSGPGKRVPHDEAESERYRRSYFTWCVRIASGMKSWPDFNIEFWDTGVRFDPGAVVTSNIPSGT